MTVTYYRLIHKLTGFMTGMYSSYESAECERNLLDDWTLWSIEPFTEQL